MKHCEHSIGRLISILYRYGQCHIGKKLDPLNIGCGQYVFLMTLFQNDGISQEELSGFLEIDKATTAKAIKKLEDEGYVTRSIDTSDKRAYKVFITKKALGIIPIIQETIKNWENILTFGLSTDEKEMFEQVLNKMAKNACRCKLESSKE